MPQKGRSRFNLSCGEHAVLGNPLYLLGTNLARYRIWDGMRGLDYLTSLPEVDPTQIGCVGNSGGGTLTAYIAALDPRVSVAAICCYITTLRRRMGNRIQEDPVRRSRAGHLRLRQRGDRPRGTARPARAAADAAGHGPLRFLPDRRGPRDRSHEAKRLYEVAGAGDRIERVEAAERHGLTLPAPHGRL